jgi:SnoaL-like domain
MSDDITPPPRPVTAAAIADRVRATLEAADVDGFGDLLSPDVRWGAPGDPNPPCRNRRQVLRWYERGRAEGRRANVTALQVHGDSLLVGLRLETGAERWQVLRVGPEGVTDIRGYEDRTAAEMAL